jgi:hypothetical protein
MIVVRVPPLSIIWWLEVALRSLWSCEWFDESVCEFRAGHRYTTAGFQWLIEMRTRIMITQYVTGKDNMPFFRVKSKPNETGSAKISVRSFSKFKQNPESTLTRTNLAIELQTHRYKPVVQYRRISQPLIPWLIYRNSALALMGLGVIVSIWLSYSSRHISTNSDLAYIKKDSHQFFLWPSC